MSTTLRRDSTIGNEGNSISPRRLFTASCVAMIATAMTFIIRGDIMSPWGAQFHLTEAVVGSISSLAFFGFTISMFVGAPLCDLLGMGRLIALAFLMHVAGILVTIFAGSVIALYIGTLFIGMGNGLVEAAVNPLIATMYRSEKTRRLNKLHVWFPGGNVIGGLTAFALSLLLTNHVAPAHLWQIKMAAILIPVFAYGFLFYGQKFPQTERVQSNVSTKEMYSTALKPLFLVFLFCMFLTASTELGTGQWMTVIMSTSLHIGLNGATTGVLVLVWINVLMAIGRNFAGNIVHRASPVALLLISSVLSCAGLLLLGTANGTLAIFAAATLFAVGVCYFWPTMLGVTSERFPRGGSVLLGLMGGSGMLFVGLALPYIGKEISTNDAHPAGSLIRMAIMPAILIVIFTVIFLRDKVRGGYKPEVLPIDSNNS